MTDFGKMKAFSKIKINRKWTVLLCIGVLLSLSAVVSNYKRTSLYSLLNQVKSSHSILSYTFSEKSTLIQCIANKDPHVIIPFSNRFLIPKVLTIRLEKVSKIKSLSAYLDYDGLGYASSRMQTVFIKNNPNLKFNIPAYKNLTSIRIDFDGNSTYGEIEIKDIHISSLGVLSAVNLAKYEAYLYIIALLVALMLILPGALITVLLGDAFSKPERIFYLFFAFSLAFYLIIYLISEMLRYFGNNSDLLILTIFVFLLAFLLRLCFKQNRTVPLKLAWKGSKSLFKAYFFLIIVCCFIAVRHVPEPFQNMTYRSISHQHWKTFYTFQSHDNLFQFVNGKAIAENEPFSKYYAKNARVQGQSLIYDVQDRQIFPGVVYSVFRKIFKGFSPYIGNSYLLYTIFGICMNSMVIFPLFALFRRYFKSDPKSGFWIPVFLSMNAHVILMVYFTWFKFTGAALFLSGLVLLLEEDNKITNWLLAGFLWGLSMCMHAGNALAFPVYFTWICIRLLRNVQSFSFKRIAFLALSPLVFLIVFATINAPWTMIKTLHFKDTSKLLRQHYLAGTAYQKDGLLGTVQLFFKNTPFEKQLKKRSQNLKNAFRIDYLVDLSKVPIESEELLKGANRPRNLSRDLKGVIKYWNFMEVLYLSINYYPLLVLFLLLSLFNIPILIQKKSVLLGKNVYFKLELTILFLLGWLTHFMIIASHYSNFVADITISHPMGVLLINMLILIGLIINSNPISLKLYKLYLFFCLLLLIS